MGKTVTIWKSEWNKNFVSPLSCSSPGSPECAMMCRCPCLCDACLQPSHTSRWASFSKWLAALLPTQSAVMAFTVTTCGCEAAFSNIYHMSDYSDIWEHIVRSSWPFRLVDTQQTYLCPLLCEAYWIFLLYCCMTFRRFSLERSCH